MKQRVRVSRLIATSLGIGLLTNSLAAVAQTAPEVEGFSSERLARIGAVMRAEIDKGTLPGAVTLIARHGRIVHFEAHGYLDGGTSFTIDPKEQIVGVFMAQAPMPRLRTRFLFKNLSYGALVE